MRYGSAASITAALLISAGSAWAVPAGAQDIAPAAAAPASRGGAATHPIPVLADSLSRLSDTTLVRQLIPFAVLPDDAPVDAHLHSALADKRIFEITDNEAARKRAEKGFERVKQRDAGNAWAHYGQATMIARSRPFEERAARFVPGYALFHSLSAVAGADPMSRARRSLRKALEIDPAFEPAVIELGRIALLSRDDDAVAQAAAAARRAVGLGVRNARMYAQLSELEILYGDHEAGANAARAGVALSSDPMARRALGVALLSLPREMEEGGKAYMESISTEAFADTALMSIYYADVLPLLLAADKERWAGMDPAARATWLRGFWDKSAARSTRSIAERLQEHFTRVRYANANYRRQGSFAQNAGQGFRIQKDLNVPMDDRGLLYIKLGKPIEVISTPAGDVVPPQNESWVYRRNGEFEMYHFHKYKGSTAWQLSPLEECDPFFIKFGGSETDRHRVTDHRVLPERGEDSGIGTESRYITYLEARAKYDGRLSTLAAKCQMAFHDVDIATGRIARLSQARAAALRRLLGPDLRSNGTVDYFRMDGREMAREDEAVARRGMESDEARPQFDAPLRIITQLYAFRGSAETTSLMAAVLVPGQRFTPHLQNGVRVFPLSLALIVVDSVTGNIQRDSDEPAFRTDEVIGRNQYFRATLAMEAKPAAAADYSVVVRNVTTPAEGDIWSGRRAIPSFAGDSLMISDLVVGEAAGGRWQRGGISMNPIPSHQVERDKSFKLFYEIYNMPASATFRTTITVTPQERGGITGAIKSLVLGKKPGRELTFDDVAPPSSGRYGIQQLRTIGGDLEYGAYTVTVTVQDPATMATVKGSTKLIVLSPKDLIEQ